MVEANKSRRLEERLKATTSGCPLMTLEMRESDLFKVVIKSIYACRFLIPIEKVFCSIRKVKEAFFILKARTIDPDGLYFVKKHFNTYISSIFFLFFFFYLSLSYSSRFKLQLRSFRVPIKKFPYHSQCELTIKPEEG